MTPKEAADKLRPIFKLEQMPAEDRHAVKFVEAVATELGVERTPFNLHQVAGALEQHEISHDPHEYPKMLFSRTHHQEAISTPSIYDKRHDHCWVNVMNAEEEAKLGSDWVDHIGKLPARGDLPVHALEKAPAEKEEVK